MSYQPPTPAQRDRQIASLLATVEVLREMPTATPCAECDHFARDSGHCQKWGATVPPEALAAGCPQWEESVPF